MSKSNKTKLSTEELALNVDKGLLDAELHNAWRELRDGVDAIASLRKAIELLGRINFLTSKEVELWRLRIVNCPGHEDEGGRSWCAYCGYLPKERSGEHL